MQASDLTVVHLSISAVERDTGLSKDTLRVWERRYGFPNPQRDAFGERIYPLDQVDRLRVIRRLMDIGHRPGKIIGLDIAELGLGRHVHRFCVWQPCRCPCRYSSGRDPLGCADQIP